MVGDLYDGHAHMLLVLGAQDEVIQGFPVASIVVTVGPSVESTLTPGNMRSDSLYVPGLTMTSPPPLSLIEQMASWMEQ